MYERTIWHYDHPKSDLIKNENSFELLIDFESCDPNEPVSILAHIVFNNMSSFVPNEATVIEDRDQVWINKRSKV